jgi:hypothetical protein
MIPETAGNRAAVRELHAESLETMEFGG